MGVDFTTVYPEGGGAPWEAECDWCGQTMDLDHHGDMEVHTSEHRDELAREQAKQQMYIPDTYENQVVSAPAPRVPLLMGDAVIGYIMIDLYDGTFSGKFADEATSILRDGIDGTVKVVSVKSIFGLTEVQDLSVQEKWQEKWQAYLLNASGKGRM